MWRESIKRSIRSSSTIRAIGTPQLVTLRGQDSQPLKIQRFPRNRRLKVVVLQLSNSRFFVRILTSAPSFWRPCRFSSWKRPSTNASKSSPQSWAPPHSGTDQPQKWESRLRTFCWAVGKSWKNGSSWGRFRGSVSRNFNIRAWAAHSDHRYIKKVKHPISSHEMSSTSYTSRRTRRWLRGKRGVGKTENMRDAETSALSVPTWARPRGPTQKLIRHDPERRWTREGVSCSHSNLGRWRRHKA